MSINWVKQRIGFVPKTKYTVDEKEKFLQPRIAIVNAYTLIAAVYCASSALLFYYVVENIFLAIVHLLALLSVLTNYLILIQTKNFKRATFIILTTGTFVVLSLFATGGWENTGYLWPFAYLPFAFFLSDRNTVRKWLAFLFGGCLIVVLMHFTGVITVPYSPVALGNYFAALFVFSACILLFQEAIFKRDEFLSDIETSRISHHFNERKKMEVEQALFTSIINTSDDAIISKTLDGIVTTWNHGAEIIFGYSAVEIIGKHISTLIPLHLQNEEREIREKVRHGKAIDHYETQRIKKNGDVIDVSLTISPLKDSLGNIVGASKISRDITDRKKMERERAWFTSIINSSDDAIISKTLDGKVTTWNRGAEKVFGYSPEEIIGKPISILIPLYLQDEEKEIMEKIRHQKPIEHYETRRIRKDGNIIDVSLTISPLKDSHGNIVGASKISRDITERKKMERERARFTSIINSSDDAIISKTLDGMVTTWNRGAEKVFGYSPEEIIGKHISILIPPHLQNEEKEIMEKIHHGTFIDHYETQRIKKDGKIIDVSLTISPLKDSHGNIVGASKISRDISERKKAEEEFRKLNESLEQMVKDRTEALESFSYSVAHDLRTPLRAVNGYTRMLEEDYSASFDDEGKRLLKGVQQNAENMGMLIDNLLAFSKLGRSSVRKSLTDMDKLTQSVLSEINQSLPNHAEIKSGNLLPAMTDSTLLKQVLSNLLSNAIKYSSKKEKPTIEIKSRRENGSLIYSVSDNGAGFDMKYAHKLFGVFERLHSNEEFPGNGVGLAIAQQIIHNHKGKIWAEGKVEKGATFFFSLPDVK